jgi:hypothetical protein
VVDRLDAVVLVQELQPGVEAENGRHHRHREVPGDRGVGLRADPVGHPQGADADVGAAPGEAAHVPLDLDRVLAQPGLVDRPGRHLFGEHRGVARTRAVHRGRRLDHELANARRFLARGEQLHGADDVDFLHRRPSPSAARGRHDACVDDRVDVLTGDDLRDDGVADVRPDEPDPAEFGPWWDDIDADHGSDTGISCQAAGTTSTGVPGDAGNHYYLCHEYPQPDSNSIDATLRTGRRELLLAELAALHPRLLQQLAVLLLRHTLTALLDNGTHSGPSKLKESVSKAYLQVTL